MNPMMMFSMAKDWRHSAHLVAEAHVSGARREEAESKGDVDEVVHPARIPRKPGAA
jgi:hypothetical protein